MPVTDLPLALEVGSGGGGAESVGRRSGWWEWRSRLSETGRDWRGGLLMPGAALVKWRGGVIAGRDSRGDAAGTCDPAGQLLLVDVELVDDRVRVTDEVLDDLVLVGQDPQRLVGLPEARVGSAKDLRQGLGATGEARTQLRDQKSEAVAVG